MAVMAEHFEYYATALNICLFEMMDDERLGKSYIVGLLDLAGKHGLYLPDRLEKLAKRQREEDQKSWI
jgi:hypothetical protein